MEYTLTESKGLEAKLLERLEAGYSKLRAKTHMSDLSLCPRQALGRKLYGEKPTHKQLGYFVDGARRHETLQELYGEGVAEKEGEFEGIAFHIDIWDGVPIELKTTRGRKAVGEHWIRQLGYYMVATGSHKGILQIQRINDKEEPFEAYDLTLEDRQFDSMLEDFRSRRSAFLAALEAKDMKLAPIWRGEGDWLCRGCRFREPCDRIEGVNRTGK